MFLIFMYSNKLIRYNTDVCSIYFILMPLSFFSFQPTLFKYSSPITKNQHFTIIFLIVAFGARKMLEIIIYLSCRQ